MTKQEALNLLESNAKLTKAQIDEIREALRAKSEENTWESSEEETWNSSNCWE